MELPSGMDVMVMPFHAPPHDFICKPKIINSNSSVYQSYDYNDWTNLTDYELSQCNVMEFDANTLTFDLTDEECQEWIFDDSTFKTSIISDFELVCDREYLITLSQSVPLLGAMFGAFTFGLVSDL